MRNRIARLLGCEGVRSEQLDCAHDSLTEGCLHCPGNTTDSSEAVLPSQDSQMSVLDPVGVENVRAVCRDCDLHGTAGQAQHVKDQPERSRMNGCLRLFNDQERRLGPLEQGRDQPQHTQRAIGHAEGVELDRLRPFPGLRELQRALVAQLLRPDSDRSRNSTLKQFANPRPILPPGLASDLTQDAGGVPPARAQTGTTVRVLQCTQRCRLDTVGPHSR